MAKRSPILGYNHNVRYRGIVFHIQTEDSGLLNPHVFSHLFHGGVILSTRKLVYDPSATEEVIKSLMQSQHKAVLRDLKRGTFDDKVDLYLGAVPGLLPRESATAEVAPAAADPDESSAPTAVAESPPTLTVAAEPADLETVPAPLDLETVPGPLDLELPPSPDLAAAPDLADAEVPAPIALAEVSAAYAAAPTPQQLVPAPDDDASAVEAIERESSAPAIEVIPGSAATLDLPPMEVEPLELDLAAAPPPELDGDDSAFGSVTARTLPPLGAIDETERVPVLELGGAGASARLGSLLPEPDLLEPEAAEPELLDSDLLEPMLPEPEPPARTRPSTPPMLPPMRPTPQWIEAVAAPPARVEPPAPMPVRVDPSAPIRAEPSRTGPFSPVRVSFVSARGPAPTLEPPAVEPPPAAEPAAPTIQTRPVFDIVPLEAIETPPAGISTFDDLQAPPLPPPPPLPTLRAAPPLPGITPPRGIAPVRPLGGPALQDTVPRLAGVPAPTPPLPAATHAAPPMMAVPAPGPSPYAGHASHPSAPRPGGSTLPRVALHSPAIDDDELLAAGFGESSDVAEIHAPPLPAANAPPGSQPERPGEYYVTRTRADAPVAKPQPPAARTPVTPPRPVPSPTRPQTSGAPSSTFRGTTPAAPPPSVGRPGLPRAGTRPPVTGAPPPRAEAPPVAPAPRPPVAARPSPRPRPTTGAGVVVSRPAVIVGAPAHPTAAPMVPARPRRARDTGSDGMVSERSLDEVILAYLSEDGNEE